MCTSSNESWSLGQKHKMGQAFFMEELRDEVRRKMHARLQELAKRRGFSKVEQLLFAREVIFELANNLVNEIEADLQRQGVNFGPSLF